MQTTAQVTLDFTVHALRARGLALGCFCSMVLTSTQLIEWVQLRFTGPAIVDMSFALSCFSSMALTSMQ